MIAVQLAVVRGARVIGTASPANHEHLRSLGPSPSPTPHVGVAREHDLQPCILTV
jgi:NADPH:quinone reductase-like Zn-dependent oxidoreductase